MSHKNPKELESGMVLAADVCNLDGQTLFRRGVTLTDRQINILLMWGVASVEIEGEDDSDARVDLDHFSHFVVERAKAEVGQRFRLVKSSHPAVDVVRNIAILQAAKSIHQLNPNS